MLLIIPKSILKLGMYVTEVKGINEVLLLQINAEAGKDWIISVAGGQHHVYVLEAQDVDKVNKAELEKWNISMKKEKDMLKGIITYGSQWLVSLFNDKSPIEGLVQKFKLMKAEGQMYQNMKLLPQSKGTVVKQLELLKQGYAWEMLTHCDMDLNHFKDDSISGYDSISAVCDKLASHPQRMWLLDQLPSDSPMIALPDNDNDKLYQNFHCLMDVSHIMLGQLLLSHLAFALLEQLLLHHKGVNLWLLLDWSELDFMPQSQRVTEELVPVLADHL
ncbi:hypothetical protein EDD15DRAFT_2202027 [Pisolithus albus]|nr:hypothetical protein EDD15DRAFT_2202027 [Pisolithus albus]